MAIYIEIDKLSEDEYFALFSYRDENGCEGKIRLDKKIGKTILVEAAPSDDKKGLYVRASYKILRHWRDGSLPASDCWAS
jgi:hypothetical protein